MLKVFLLGLSTILMSVSVFATNFREPNFQIAPDELKKLCVDARAKLTSDVAQLSALPEKTVSFKNLILPLEKAITQFSDVVSPYQVFSFLIVGTELQKTVREFCKPDLDFVFSQTALAEKVKQVKLPTNTEDLALLKYDLLAFQNAGAYLSQSAKAELILLNETIRASHKAYYSGWSSSEVAMAPSEIDGMTPEEVATLKKDASGQYLFEILNFDYLKKFNNAETRLKYLQASFSATDSSITKVIEQSAVAKMKVARLFGYPTWLDFKIKSMAFSDKVSTLKLVDRVNAANTAKLKNDMVILADTKIQLDPTAGPLQLWDFDYYSEKWLKQNRHLDLTEISKYFPAKSYTEKVFALYARLFSLKFVKNKGDAKLWHDSVDRIEVYDQKTLKPLGIIYSDITFYPGKLSTVGALSVTREPRLEAGTRVPALCSIRASFIQAQDDLLTHGLAVKFAHELGHCIHQIVYAGKYASLRKTPVDFSELPSQIMEFFLWSKEGLKILTEHYQHPGQVMPDDMMEQIVQSMNDDRGVFAAFYATANEFDLAMHSIQSEIFDPIKTHCNLFNKNFGFQDAIICKSNPFAGHFMHYTLNGYGGSYYAYDLDMLLAKDIFNEVVKNGITSPDAMLTYRKKILEPGGTRPALQLIKDYLGRAPLL